MLRFAFVLAIPWYSQSNCDDPHPLNVGLHRIFQTTSLCGDCTRHLHSIDPRGRIPFIGIDDRVHRRRSCVDALDRWELTTCAARTTFASYYFTADSLYVLDRWRG